MDTDAHAASSTPAPGKIKSLTGKSIKLTETYEPYLSSRLRAIQAFDARGDLSNLTLDIFASLGRRSDTGDQSPATSGQGLSE